MTYHNLVVCNGHRCGAIGFRSWVQLKQHRDPVLALPMGWTESTNGIHLCGDCLRMANTERKPGQPNPVKIGRRKAYRSKIEKSGVK
jgi:hypothetical protein